MHFLFILMANRSYAPKVSVILRKAQSASSHSVSMLKVRETLSVSTFFFFRGRRVCPDVSLLALLPEFAYDFIEPQVLDSPSFIH